MYTIVLAGPARSRAKIEVALEAKNIAVLPVEHYAVMDWHAKYPDSDEDWITAQADHPDDVAPLVKTAKAKWRLHAHYPTPDEPQPSAEQQLAATITEMQQEIAALKARIG